LKPIFDSKSKSNLQETRAFADYIQANILVMLHPFIPFFTEKLWLDLKLDKNLKTPLMYKDWILPFKTNNSFKKSYQKVDWLIQLVTSIRSTKVDLDVSPGAFIDISVEDLSINKSNIIKDNIEVFKRLGRVTNIHNSKLNKNGINMIVDIDHVTLYFEDNINLNDQAAKLESKIKELDMKISTLNKKLKNNSFLENAPKLIVQKDKSSLQKNDIELKKLNSVLNSIKN
jgi:valyl-tRNA synthetase